MIEVPYKKTQCLELPEQCEIKLFKVFMMLNQNHGATYMSYTFDKSNYVRFSFRTDSKWASIYHNQELFGKPLIESCPLDIVSRQKKNTFIIWDLYKHHSQPKAYKEIMGMREDVGLKHGITLSTYFNDHHDALAIATEESSNDLASEIILNDKGESLKKSLLICRNEILTALGKI